MGLYFKLKDVLYLMLELLANPAALIYLNYVDKVTFGKWQPLPFEA